ncbi:hypothetical protein Bbelb_438760 [Branchiostoma belcheri]|nr:hypothetical protein Bbelb_438760 [Branchiostoma belcheri]
MRLAMGAGNMAAYRVFLYPVRPRARSVSLAAVPEILPLHSQRLKQSFLAHLGRCGSSLRLTARPFPAPGLSEPQMKRFYNYGNLASQDGCGILCDRSATVDCKEISCPNVARQCDTCGSADTQVSVTFNDQGKQWWVKGCARSEIWGQRPCQVTDAGKISDVIPNFTASVQVVTSPVASGVVKWTLGRPVCQVGNRRTDGQCVAETKTRTILLLRRLPRHDISGGRLEEPFEDPREGGRQAAKSQVVLPCVYLRRG